MYIFFKGQSRLEVYNILDKHKNILWINISAPSLGDSLMDLSSRTLLQNKNIDLFTDKKNSQLYLSDQYFKNVFVTVDEVSHKKYDLVIIDSYSTRSMRIKSIIARKTTYVGIFGYFNGPEVNRILFSFFQMNNLLGGVKTEKQIENLAKNTIQISQEDETLVQNIIPKKFIAFVLGGEWEYKTYSKWGKVIDNIIINSNNTSGIYIILLGSKNAIKDARKILVNSSYNKILNFVDKLSFNQTAQVIKKSQIVFCCDGGLMHAANAVNSRNISLYARLTPEMLSTKNSKSIILFDKKDVNNISSKAIIQKYNEFLRFSDNHPQGE